MGKVICVNDKVVERYGFLWLKSRTLKHPHFTEGKTYEVIETTHTAHGMPYSAIVFSFYVIKGDLGEVQLIDIERFTPV